MRRALQDQLRAIEQLSQISQRANAPREIMRPEPSPARLAPTASLTSALIQQEAASGRARGGAQADQREGWSLGDLLARASHDDEGPQSHLSSASEQPAPSSGGPVRLDVGMIARALDQQTASAIWSRIRAGQRNVLVRSIYAPEARILFDEISARAQTDADLSQSIFRYLTDFERIIKEADTRDTTGRTAQSHLVSDTGRVYLFLAHAVGRIR
jgi:hypothetical protein